MKIKLYHRHYGVHSFLKEVQVECSLNEVFFGEDDVNELKLLEVIPESFLPAKPSKTLLTVENEFGSTGQYGLKHFRNWAKYFDAYVLELGC